jgi:hypothetical protein
LVEIPLAAGLNHVQFVVSGNIAVVATETVNRFEISVD